MLIDKKYVPRHEKSFIICHWLNAVSFLMLFLTALPLYADTFRFLYDIFGAHTLQILHRVFAVVFIATPLIGMLIARKGFGTLAKEVLSFDKDDMVFMQKFPPELIGVHPAGMPKQTFYNGGEKMNISLQAVIWLLLVVSGLIIWFGNGVFGKETLAWMIPLHSIAAGIGFAAAIGHIYLAASVNPDSMRGMQKGNIDARYANAHHGKWIDELIAKGELTREEVDKAIGINQEKPNKKIG